MDPFNYGRIDQTALKTLGRAACRRLIKAAAERNRRAATMSANAGREDTYSAPLRALMHHQRTARTGRPWRRTFALPVEDAGRLADWQSIREFGRGLGAPPITTWIVWQTPMSWQRKVAALSATR